MSETFYNKLIRDKIPEIIIASGDTPITRVLDIEECKIAALEKLVEESKELLESRGDIDERADIAEILRLIDEIYGWGESDVENARKTKKEKRGGFDERLYLERTINK